MEGGVYISLVGVLPVINPDTDYLVSFFYRAQ